MSRVATVARSEPQQVPAHARPPERRDALPKAAAHRSSTTTPARGGSAATRQHPRPLELSARDPDGPTLAPPQGAATDVASRDALSRPFDDAVAEFVRALESPSTAEACEGVARQIDEAIADAVPGDGEKCSFSIEVMRLGIFEGEVSMRDGQVRVELRASRPAAASFLASRRIELQRAVRQRSGGEVVLSIGEGE